VHEMSVMISLASFIFFSLLRLRPFISKWLHAFFIKICSRYCRACYYHNFLYSWEWSYLNIYVTALY